MADQISDPGPAEEVTDTLGGPDVAGHEDELGGPDVAGHEDELGGPDAAGSEDELGGHGPA
jgi:hypothetical protein